MTVTEGLIPDTLGGGEIVAAQLGALSLHVLFSICTSPAEKQSYSSSSTSSAFWAWSRFSA